MSVFFSWSRQYTKNQWSGVIVIVKINFCVCQAIWTETRQMSCSCPLRSSNWSDVHQVVLQSNLGLRSSLYTYFWFTYYFLLMYHSINVLKFDLRTSFYILKFNIRTSRTLSEVRISNSSSKTKYVNWIRVRIESNTFFPILQVFLTFLFWVRHADEWQSTCSNSIERKETDDFNFTLQ